MKAQESLDKNFPKDQRKNLPELDLRNLNLEGDLDLEGFNGSFENPLKIYLAGNPNLGKIKNRPARTTIFYKSIQEWLEEKYPSKESKEKLKWIDIDTINRERENQGTTEKLEGRELNLREYPNLER